MGFLKTVLILLLVYYLLKILARWFAPKLFTYAARKTEAHFREKFGTFNGPEQNQNEQFGDVIINKKNRQNRVPQKKLEIT